MEHTLKLPPDLFVMKALTQAGRRYQRGDVLPWRDVGITERRALQLVDQRYCSMVHPDELLKSQQEREAARSPKKTKAKKSTTKAKSTAKVKTRKPKEAARKVKSDKAKTARKTASEKSKTESE